MSVEQEDAPGKLLVCVDEISKLVDDSRCSWARVSQPDFWNGLYAVSRTTSHWVRFVMTGFTDFVENSIVSSDLRCETRDVPFVNDHWPRDGAACCRARVGLRS